MKKRLIIASAILALVSVSLCGCTEKEPAALFDPAEPTSSINASDDKSAPESSPESTSTSSESESEPQGVSEFPVKNTASLTVTKTRYEDGKTVSAGVYTYDDHGSLIRARSKYEDYPYVNENNFYAYEYNDDGTVSVMYDDEYREEYEYENGLEIKRTKYDSSGRVVSSMEHTYDEHGNELSFTNTVLGSVDYYTCKYTYNENGFWTKLFIYEGDGAELQMIITRTLDENGKDIGGTREKRYTLLTYEIKYDEEGREIELHSTQTRGEWVEEETRLVTEYDEQGRVSRIIEYRLDGGERIASMEEYKYSIDN